MMRLSQKGVAAATLASFCWGSATVMSKHALDEVSPVTLLALQLAASAVFLSLVIWYIRIEVSAPKTLAPVALLGLLEPGLAYFLGLIALTDMGAGSATLILASEAIMIVMLSALLFRQIPNFRFVILSLVAFFGLVIALGFFDTGSEQNGAFGVSLMFLATANAAVYVVLCGRIASIHSPVVVVASQQWVALAAVIVVLPIELFVSADISLPSTTETWVLVIASGIIQYGVAFSLYLYALSKLSTNLVGSFLNLIPVFGLSIAFVTLGETLSVFQVVGAAVTISALVLLTSKFTLSVEPDRTSL